MYLNIKISLNVCILMKLNENDKREKYLFFEKIIDLV